MDQASFRRNAQCIKTAQRGTSKESQHLRVYCAQRLVRGKEDSERNSDDVGGHQEKAGKSLGYQRSRWKASGGLVWTCDEPLGEIELLIQKFGKRV